MCFAQGHNTVLPMRLEPATPLSQVKHSTTEPLRSRTLHHNESHIVAHRYMFNQKVSCNKVHLTRTLDDLFIYFHILRVPPANAIMRLNKGVFTGPRCENFHKSAKLDISKAITK